MDIDWVCKGYDGKWEGRIGYDEFVEVKDIPQDVLIDIAFQNIHKWEEFLADVLHGEVSTCNTRGGGEKDGNEEAHEEGQ